MNPYEILGVLPSSSCQEIRVGFKRKALAAHPDKPGGTKEDFQRVLAAFEILVDPSSRARYDASVAMSASMPPTRDEGHPAAKSSETTHPPSTGKMPPRGDDGRAPSRSRTKRKRVPTSRCEREQGEQRRNPWCKKGDDKAESTSKWKGRNNTGCVRESTDGTFGVEPTFCRAKHDGANQRLLACLQTLLRRLQPETRRHIITHIPHDLRIALSNWMVRQRQTTTSEPRVKAEVSVDMGSLTVPRHGTAFAGDEKENDATKGHSMSENESSDDTDGSLGVTSAVALREGVRQDRLSNGQRITSLREVNGIDETEEEEEEEEEEEADEERGLFTAHLAGSEANESDGLLALEDSMLNDSASVACIEDGHAPQASMGSEGKGRMRVRGLSSTLRNGKLYYWASVYINTIRVTSKVTCDLSIVLDFLALLSAAARRISFGSGSFENRVMDAFLYIAQDVVGAGPSHIIMSRFVEQLGITFRLTLTRSFWTGRRKLYTPGTTCLEEVLATWRRFSQLPCAGGYRGSRQNYSKWAPGLVESDWRSFCKLLEDEWSKVGKSRHETQQKLHAMEVESAPNRERMMERWNARRMLQEERSQRQASLHELARQRRLRRVEARLRRVVALWQQQCARAAETAARCQLRSARDAKRREKIKRDERWKRMNRRDITMAELLAGQ